MKKFVRGQSGLFVKGPHSFGKRARRGVHTKFHLTCHSLTIT